MLHGVEIKSAVQELRHEGFAFLYRGILPPLAQRTVSLSLMFGLYDGTKRPLVKLGVNEYLAKTVAGMTAGKYHTTTISPQVSEMKSKIQVGVSTQSQPFSKKIKLICCTFFYLFFFFFLGTVEAILMPFERIQTLLADSHYHAHFKNTSQAFHYVCMNYGYGELYRGITPILLRNGPSNVLFFIMREEAAAKLPKRVCIQPSSNILNSFFYFPTKINGIFVYFRMIIFLDRYRNFYREHLLVPF